MLTSSSEWLKERGVWGGTNGPTFSSGERKQNLYSLGCQIMTEFSVPTGFHMPHSSPYSSILQDFVWPLWKRGCAAGREWVDEEVLFLKQELMESINL